MGNVKMEKMKIREARKGDLKEIARIIKAEYMKHYEEKWTSKNAIKTLNYFFDVGHIFVMEDQSDILGAIIFREEYYNDMKSVMIEELVVDGKFQGIGIGKKLVSFVEEYCKKNNIGFIWLMTNKNTRAFGFYDKIGYKYNEDVTYFSKEVK